MSFVASRLTPFGPSKNGLTSPKSFRGVFEKRVPGPLSLRFIRLTVGVETKGTHLCNRGPDQAISSGYFIPQAKLIPRQDPRQHIYKERYLYVWHIKRVTKV